MTIHSRDQHRQQTLPTATSAQSTATSYSAKHHTPPLPDRPQANLAHQIILIIFTQLPIEIKEFQPTSWVPNSTKPWLSSPSCPHQPSPKHYLPFWVGVITLLENRMSGGQHAGYLFPSPNLAKKKFPRRGGIQATPLSTFSGWGQPRPPNNIDNLYSATNPNKGIPTYILGAELP